MISAQTQTQSPRTSSVQCQSLRRGIESRRWIKRYSKRLAIHSSLSHGSTFFAASAKGRRTVLRRWLYSIHQYGELRCWDLSWGPMQRGHRNLVLRLRKGKMHEYWIRGDQLRTSDLAPGTSDSRAKKVMSIIARCFVVACVVRHQHLYQTSAEGVQRRSGRIAVFSIMAYSSRCPLSFV